MRTPTPWILPNEPITRSQLLATGVTPRMIRTALDSGRLVQVRRGAYLGAESLAEDPVGQHLARSKAEQALHPRAVLSHNTAALIWDLPHPDLSGWAEERVSLTLPRGVHGSRDEHVVRRNGLLPADQVHRTSDGLLVTSPARTAVDLAASRELPHSLVILDGAARSLVGSMVGRNLRRRDYANPRFVRAAVELLAEAASTIKAARLESSIALVDPSRESAAESLSAGQIALAGLPAPRCQVELRVAGGTVFPDFYWESRRLVGEVDGAVKYTNATAFVLEKEREQKLRDQGYRIVRWLAKEIMFHPSRVIDRIARAGDF